jgi:transcription initiation factor IIE alpha subunit
MTPERWRLGRQVVAILETETGLTDAEIAKRLGVTVPELRPVLGALYGMRHVDFCCGYVVFPPRPDQSTGRAA